MKTEEMADILDGLVTFTERIAGKTALNDIVRMSACLRQYPGETVASFCGIVDKARENKPARRSSAKEVNQERIEPLAREIDAILDRPLDHSYAEIADVMDRIDKQLKAAEIKALGMRIGCTLSARTKHGMVSELKNWVENIKAGTAQSSFKLSGAAS